MTFSFSDQYDKSYMLADKEVIDLKSEPAAGALPDIFAKKITLKSCCSDYIKSCSFRTFRLFCVQRKFVFETTSFFDQRLSCGSANPEVRTSDCV